nr:EOG090X04LH [Leptodora kindtii]
MDSDNILHSSIKSTSYDMVYQVLFKVVTFILNGLILHNADKEILGIMNSRLALLLGTVLFVSREAFRKSCVRNTYGQNWAKVINLTWLTVPSAIVCSLCFCCVWLHWLQLPSEPRVADYRLAVYVLGTSCFVESFAEPLYIFAQAFRYFRIRLLVDCVMMAFKIFPLAATVLVCPEHTLKAFAIGHLAASFSLVTLYAWYFRRKLAKKHIAVKNKESQPNDPLLTLPFDSMRDFLPRKLTGQPSIDRDLAKLTWSFFKQGILKQILTSGEGYITTVFSVLTFAEQGVYDVVNNLGTMAARLLFAPVEESSYMYFAQMIDRNMPLHNQPPQQVTKLSQVLSALLKFASLAGAIVLIFGFSYSHLLLRIYGGTCLTDGPGPNLMRAHFAYVLLLGINGVTEAYVRAAMSSQQLDGHNRVMVVLSATFLILSWLLSRALGGVGFILANGINMLVRIGYSINYIKNHYSAIPEGSPLGSLIPNGMQVTTLALAFLIIASSEVWIYPSSWLGHLVVGGVCGVAVLVCVLVTDKELPYLWGFQNGEHFAMQTTQN